MAQQFTPTDEQQKILDIKFGSHLVLAPPGSGKTELLAHRVFSAKNDGFADTNIICLTFTNRAAKVMKERIEEKYSNNQIIIGNIHHFCTKFLFKNKLISLNTAILDEEESDQLINDLKSEYNYSDQVYNPELLKLATYLKQKDLGFPEEVLLLPKYSEIQDLSHAKRVCDAYSKEKHDNNYLDFDDLLTLTYYHLTHSDKKDLSLSQFNWIQVDEVQDLNPLQWAIIDEITAPEALTVLFGDYEQAIFSFMGAKLDSLHKLEKRLKSNPQNGIHNLLKNFRSPSYLLDIYIKYAQTHWIPIWKKPPVPNITQEAPSNALCIFETDGTILNEAIHISRKILPEFLINEGNTAIIVRYNDSADIISDCLKENNVPHFKVSGFDIFRRSTVKGLMAFFSVFQNEFDRLSWARLFYEFEVIETLKQSKTFINELITKGITVHDLLEHNVKNPRLVDFFNIFTNREMIVFDTETTGLDIENDDIIQIAAVKISKGTVIDIFEIYIQTEKDITESEKVHHITKDYLNEFGVMPEKGLMDFMQFCGQNAVLVAHNIYYDFAILQNNLLRFCKISISDYCFQKFDSILIVKLIYPKLASYNLEELISFLNIEGTNSHNALDDAKATVSLIKKLNIDYLKNLKDAQFEYLSNQDNILILNNFIKIFKNIYSRIQTQLELHITLSQAINQYLEYYKNEFCPKKEDWDYEMDEIDKLLKHIYSYTNKNDKETLRQKINKYIPEYKMFKEADLYLGIEKVLISTVYKAKGLEFDNVIVAEATDDCYPHLYPIKKQIADRQRCKVYKINWGDVTSQEKRLLEEQTLESARAFYVAMTRSKKKLYITWHKQGPFLYEDRNTGQSIFLTREKSRYIKCISEFFLKVKT